MVWRRLPTYLPNLQLKLLPLKGEQLKQLQETGWLKEVAFRTTPNVNKVEIKAYLESVYSMAVESVHTINYLGKRRITHPSGRGIMHTRDPDWKKAYVVFAAPKQTPAGAAKRQP